MNRQDQLTRAERIEGTMTHEKQNKCPKCGSNDAYCISKGSTMMGFGNWYDFRLQCYKCGEIYKHYTWINGENEKSSNYFGRDE